MHALLAMSRPLWFDRFVEWSAIIVEAVGVGVIVVGSVVVLLRFGVEATGQADRLDAYRKLRRRLGRAILLGLEFLVAADIIATVMIDPSLSSVASLGLVVLIRTFLSWSLEVELEGRWPWQGRGEDLPA